MKTKKIIFEEDDDQYARLLVRLRYDKLTQGMFFRGIVGMYVDNNLDMSKIILKIKEKNRTMGKRKIEKSISDIEKGEKMKSDLNLSDAEKSFVFDLIEEDFE
tara:strand:+ start:6403 stop:6711 length:309 start_codon:yes stop_codon:yes gene_type:complete